MPQLDFNGQRTLLNVGCKAFVKHISNKSMSLEELFFWLKHSFTSPDMVQMLPQDLSCSAVGHQAQESLSVQATQITALQASQVWSQAVETKLSLAPVQPVVHLPLRP